ncbi:MAG: CocE/NonD family hydrolase [Chloroflexi bacterium]|nr:CocE/NonD family hydrolase [Chloroflexota bacterium]
MRDGVDLYADVYLPDGNGRHPALLCRTPYDKSGKTSGSRFSLLDALTAAERGYAVVMQDVRGRFTNREPFVPFEHEARDGYDTVEWVAGQPWCDGNVGMFGRSYVGATQWLAATTHPPHLKAIFPGVTASDYHEGWTYQGGAFELQFNLSWTLYALTARHTPNLRKVLRLSEGQVEATFHAVDETDDAFRALPLTRQPRLPERLAPYYFEWLAHPSDDAYWRKWRIEDAYSNTNVPAFNFGGWYDIFLLGTIRNYLGMRKHGANARARDCQRLVIGPWSHTTIGTYVVGTQNFGVNATNFGYDLDEALFRWYDYWLKGKANGIDREHPVKLFVMGDNVWRDEEEWPLARATRTKFYLHSDGRANTRRGDGRLSTDMPGTERPDIYLYDPLDPVPTRGGPLCCSPGFAVGGPFDHQQKEDRPDVLVYSTPPLEADVEVTGPVKLTVWARSSATDTDFTGMLLDVAPSGEAKNLTDGILRARYRRSRGAPSLLTPGKVEKFEIDLVATSNVFKKGRRIRLEVSSSNFPRFDRNLNTGKSIDDDDVRVATNTVLHDRAHPSYLELDIVPR